ncbi:uncharacterized protein METZ01_LOCUS88368 [marine metagenome]|uniref:Uncharacterized protein n=1 Tax=marine metagenome TaxID=408172 RepID=A0A381V5N5_9ZZZZ
MVNQPATVSMTEPDRHRVEIYFQSKAITPSLNRRLSIGICTPDIYARIDDPAFCRRSARRTPR